ncbi:MAG: glycosyltransferase [Candidatus Aenigmarchaeota archaeon]|nr:glycosyltransferase [Candidatus Aenigmarchaeota archaeon]
MKAVKISVIIPALNEKKYLEDCLKSIKNQSVEHEIIVVCPKKDSAVEMANKYAKVVFVDKRGVSLARNKGAEKARGKILIFADADVRFSDDAFEKIKQKFKGNTGGMIFNLKPWDAENKCDKMIFYLWNRIVSFLNFFRIPFTNGSCFAFTRQAFSKVRGFDEFMLTNEDHDIAKRISKYYRFVFSDVIVYTSLRRLHRCGMLKFLKQHVKSTFLYFVFKKGNPGYWDS